MDPTTATAAELDAADPLARFRTRFELPDGIYLVGNSLGALPRATREYVTAELDRWSRLGVTGHFDGDPPWTEYHRSMQRQLAGLVGAREPEVTVMNSLTVNLHLLLVSFYRPTDTRHKVLIEGHAFPSDHFAVESQIRQRQFDPTTSMVVVHPEPGKETLRPDAILAAIAEHGPALAVVLLPGIQYYTGQVLPMADITKAAHEVGAVVGFDLAHAAGNIEMHLHDWGVDFAAWCTYKYLNSGPGGVGAAYVHERHMNDQTLPKFLGWWGTNLATRFEMSNEFEPIPTAESWQLSNGPVLSQAALRASLDLIDEAGGISALRRKSELQIAYLDRRLAESTTGRVANITPAALAERGCQVGLRILSGDGKRVFDELSTAGVHCDWRYPDVIRAAPVPLYNSFGDIDRFVSILSDLV